MKKGKNYDRAITLIQHQVQLYWLVSTAFLITETVVLGSILSIENDSKNDLIFLLSLFGLLVSIAWWSSNQYNHSIYLLRIEEAKKFEPKKSRFFENGGELIEKRKIKIGDKSLIIPWDGGSPKKAVSTMIFLIAIAFLVLGVHNNPFFTLHWNFCFTCNPAG